MPVPNIRALKISLNALNDITRKKKKEKEIECLWLLFIVPYEFIFSSSGILELRGWHVHARRCSVATTIFKYIPT